MTFGRTGPLGGADTSVFLDGSDGAYLDAGAPAVDTGSTFSVSAWVNLAQQPDGDVTVVSQDGVAQPGFDLGYDADTQSWTFSIPVSDMQTMGSWTVSGAKAVPGTWTHLIYRPCFESRLCSSSRIAVIAVWGEEIFLTGSGLCWSRCCRSRCWGGRRWAGGS